MIPIIEKKCVHITCHIFLFFFLKKKSASFYVKETPGNNRVATEGSQPFSNVQETICFEETFSSKKHSLIVRMNLFSLTVNRKFVCSSGMSIRVKL